MENNRTIFCRTKGNMLVAFCMIMLIFLTAGTRGVAQPSIPYVEISSDNKTMTFKYGVKPDDACELNIGNNKPEWNSKNVSPITKVVFDASFASVHPKSCAYWFQGFNSLKEIENINNLHTDDVANMKYMFYNCYSLPSLTLGSNFKTTNVEDMSYMFYNCYQLERLDLSNFNTSNVKNMSSMFNGCHKIVTIMVTNKWNTNKVTSSTDMFLDCTSLVGCQCTAYNSSHKDKSYAHIDGGASNPGYLSDNEAYAVLNGTTLTFYYDKQKETRTGTKYAMNRGSNDPAWYSRTSYLVSIGNWGTSVNQNEIIKVVFNASFANYKPITCYKWFEGCNKLTSIEGIEYLKTDYVTNMSCMFRQCISLTALDVSKFNTGNVTNMSNMFVNCGSLSTLDVSKFNTEKVTSMSYMFNGCSGLAALDVSKFNTGNVTNMSEMFYGCSGLAALDVSKFNTEKVTNMYFMFSGCSGLAALDVSKFDTRNVTDMTGMFSGCSGLAALDVSKFNTGNVTSMLYMFN